MSFSSCGANDAFGMNLTPEMMKHLAEIEASYALMVNGSKGAVRSDRMHPQFGEACQKLLQTLPSQHHVRVNTGQLERIQRRREYKVYQTLQDDQRRRDSKPGTSRRSHALSRPRSVGGRFASSNAKASAPSCSASGRSSDVLQLQPIQGDSTTTGTAVPNTRNIDGCQSGEHGCEEAFAYLC